MESEERALARAEQGIAVLNDYIKAVRYHEDGARRLLAREEWRIADAREVLKAELEREGSPRAEGWAGEAHEVRKSLNPYAHTGELLLSQTAREQGDSISFAYCPTLDETKLGHMGALYAELAVDAVLSIGIALDQYLPDRGAWSRRQRAFWERWFRYRDQHFAHFQHGGQ